MPRIRTLKPQFWDSPSTAKADLACRLLFMAMWNWADDAGRGTANLKELEAFAFPHDDIADLPRRGSSGISAPVWRNFAELFSETVEVYNVAVYVHHGRKYYEISSFRVHQSKNFRPDSNLPGPDDGQKWDIASEYGLRQLGEPPQSAEVPPDSSGNSALSCRTSPLDRDEDRDRDEDKNPPTPHPIEDTLCEPQPPRTKTGADIARTRITNLPTRASQAAMAIAHAYNDTLDVALTPKLLREVATEIDGCLRANNPPEAIAAGIQAWTASDSWAPTQIPRFVHKANNRTRANGHGTPTTKALDYDAAAARVLQAMGATP
ncbi:MAG: hypothetical protein PGN37_20515 [Mycobacterium kyogaense]|uniref:hypothetical protein n=1 Tax=Mycobacterium kyogaense TaxID=2212479 RepID=UPI002FF47320